MMAIGYFCGTYILAQIAEDMFICFESIGQFAELCETFRTLIICKMLILESVRPPIFAPVYAGLESIFYFHNHRTVLVTV
jgi:hypothetical protein